MRVLNTDLIAGLPAELARAIVRKFRGREMVAEAVADLIDGTGHDLAAVLAGLEAAGFMEIVRVDDESLVLVQGAHPHIPDPLTIHHCLQPSSTWN